MKEEDLNKKIEIAEKDKKPLENEIVSKEIKKETNEPMLEVKDKNENIEIIRGDENKPNEEKLKSIPKIKDEDISEKEGDEPKNEQMISVNRLTLRNPIPILS